MTTETILLELRREDDSRCFNMSVLLSLLAVCSSSYMVHVDVHVQKLVIH